MIWQDLMEMLYSTFDSVIDDLFSPLFAGLGLDFLFYSACFLVVSALMRLIIMPLVGGRGGSSPLFGALGSNRKNKNDNSKGGKGK